MELIIFIVIVGLILESIGRIGEYFSDKKHKRLKIDKEKKDNHLNQVRRTKKIVTPSTDTNYFPTLKLPKNDELYNYSSEFYNIKPEFSKSEIFDFETVKGAVEEYFFLFLKTYFDENLISNNKYRIKVSNSNYIPDFTFIDSSNSILIDIEIDEPYSFKEKKIIHYGTTDDYRNRHFQRAGWAVIRFSEKQIFEQPDSCCKFIAQYHAFKTLDNSILSGFDNIPDIIKEKRWSYSDAEHYVSTDYRSKYLTK